MKKRPLREKAHTAIFFNVFFLKKKGPCGKMPTRLKNILLILFFSGKGIFTYYKFSHLTTIFFIGKNSYFSYTIFLLQHNGVLLQHNGSLLQHNGVLLQHNGVLLQHDGVLLQHNGVLLQHNEVLLQHNEVLLQHKRAKIRGKWSDSS